MKDILGYRLCASFSNHIFSQINSKNVISYKMKYCKEIPGCFKVWVTLLISITVYYLFHVLKYKSILYSKC